MEGENQASKLGWGGGVRGEVFDQRKVTSKALLQLLQGS